MGESTTLIPINTEIGVSRKRWLILAIFFCFGFINQLQYVAFATIVRQVQSFYGVSALAVNMLAATFPVVYVLLVFPGCKIYDVFGLRGGMLAGTTANFLGALLKQVTAMWYPQYWLLCVAQVLNAIAQVFFLSLPPLVASTWFADNERTLATAVGSLSGYVGLAVGLFYSPLLVTDGRSDSRDFSILFATQFFVALLVWVGTIVFMESAPPMSPSRTAMQFGAMEVMPVLKRMLRNPHLVGASMAFGCVMGAFTALATVMAEFLEPLGVSEKQTGIISFIGILLGAANCAVVGPLVDRTRQYKRPLIVMFSLLLFLSGIVMALIKTVPVGSFLPAAYVLIILIEVILLPTVPITMELAVEMAYPDSPSIASSIVIAALSLWAVVATLVYSAILGNDPTIDASFMLMAVTAGGIAGSITGLCFVREDLRRLGAERSASDSPTIQTPTASP